MSRCHIPPRLQGVQIVHEQTCRLAARRQVAEHLRVRVRRGHLIEATKKTGHKTIDGKHTRDIELAGVDEMEARHQEYGWMIIIEHPIQGGGAGREG